MTRSRCSAKAELELASGRRIGQDSRWECGRSKRFDFEGIKHTCRAYLATAFPVRFPRSAG